MISTDMSLVNDKSEFFSLQRQRIQEVLTQFSSDYSGLTNMLLATVDGFEIAAVFEEYNSINMRRLAAMTSSMLSIGIAMFKEIDAGDQRLLTLEGNKNNVVIMVVNSGESELILTLVSSSTEPLGKLFWLIRKLSSEILKVYADSLTGVY